MCYNLYHHTLNWGIYKYEIYLHKGKNMLRMNYKLQQLEEEQNQIKASIVGAGQMGRGLTSQMNNMKGMIPAVVVDTDINRVLEAFEKSNIEKDQYVITNNRGVAEDALKKGKLVASENFHVATETESIQVVIDATGENEAGAQIAVSAIKNKKHIVMLNVEADVVFGPILKKMADNQGVVYTGSAGDEPGAVKELFDFADALGFDVKVFGKGKNNKVDIEATPESLYHYAIGRGVAPRMQCAFTDGSKTMVEMTCMANATGFVPDVRGGHGPKSSIKEITKVLSTKEEGGILNSYNTIEWVRGIAPGVFVIFSSDLPFVKHELSYIEMGDGPNYVLYRPYHLCSLETPLTAARAVIENESTIVPLAGPVCETIAVAKKDIKQGELIDGIGGFCTYGTIDTYETSKKLNALPQGLITDKTKALADIKKGEVITMDKVYLDSNSYALKLRQRQDEIFG